jgi:hypothetical protein
MHSFKLLVIFALLALWPQVGNAAWTLLAHGTAQQNGGGAPVSTGALNCTGATLLAVGISNYSTVPTVSDSQSNSWVLATSNTTNTSGEVYLYYVYVSSGSQVSSTQTFTIVGGGNFATEFVQCWAGSRATPLDQTNGGSATFNFTLQTGSITPTLNNELVISVIDDYQQSALAIDSGFTISDSTNWGGSGTSNAGGMAYLIQGTAAATNPTWSWTTQDQAAAIIASFFSAARTCQRSLRGVGC